MSAPWAPASPIVPVAEIDPDIEPWISATQVDNYELCGRKWGFRWLDGIKADPNKFAQLGLDTHGPMEHWLKYGTVPTGTDKASQLAQALIPYVPPPQAVDPANVERDELIVVDDVMFVVKVDLYMPLVESVQRVCAHCGTFVYDTDSGTTCLNGHGGAPFHEVLVRRPRVYDHKTCGTFDYCVTERDIEFNAQAALYALWALIVTESRLVDVQWNYARTKGAIKVRPVLKPVDDRMIVPRMEKSVQTGREIKWHLKNTKRALDIMPNPNACDEYGGCPYKERCGITARQRIGAIMSDNFKQGAQQFLQNFGNGQPGTGPNGQPLVNPPQFVPPAGAPQFAPPAGAPQFAPPAGAPQFAPPAGAPQFAPPAGAPTQFSPPAGFAPQGGPPPTPQFAPPQMPPAAAPQFAPPQAAPAPQYAPQPAAAPQPQWQAPQGQQAPPAAWQAPQAPPAQQAPPAWQAPAAAPAPAPQPAPAQQFVPPGTPQAEAKEKGPGRPSKSKEYDMTGAWQRFYAAAIPLVQGNKLAAAQIADDGISELKARQ